jgi:hypothetical protein
MLDGKAQARLADNGENFRRINVLLIFGNVGSRNVLLRNL